MKKLLIVWLVLMAAMASVALGGRPVLDGVSFEIEQGDQRARGTLIHGGRPRSFDGARLFRQHDRNAVADRISELGRAGDQLLLLGVVFERARGERADQDFKQFGIDRAGRAVRRR